MSVAISANDRTQDGSRLVLPDGHRDPAIFAIDAMAEDPERVTDFLAGRVGGGGAQPGIDVLDVACGTGARLVAMTARGWRVQAREADRRLRAAARARAGAEVHIDGAGPLELDVHRAFDLVAAWDGVLVYLRTLGQRLTALRRFLRALRPGGVLVLEMPDLLWSLSRGLPEEVRTVEPVPGWRITRTRTDRADLDAAVVIRRDLHRIEDPTGAVEEVELVHRLSISTAQELAHGLQQAGFSHVETWAGVDAPSPSWVEGPRFIVVARR